jgi:thiosulfate/3-mercaptopyruvate sulfurtransferase
MPLSELPLIVEPEALEPLLEEEKLLVVDLSKATVYAQLHVPGAVHLEYDSILSERKPTAGLLPATETLAETFSRIGISDETHVVAYDDEGGGKAGRLLWTLDVLGHKEYSLLNGGLHAWANEQHPLERQPATPARAEFVPAFNDHPVATAEYILDNLGNPGISLLDTRTAEEYSGAKRFSARGGHIPGAANWDWMEAMDRWRNLRLKPADELLHTLAAMEITPDKEVITYCQTHHRASFTWVVLKALGFQKVKGYPGSWSDWGNRQDTPVE